MPKAVPDHQFEISLLITRENRRKPVTAILEPAAFGSCASASSANRSRPANSARRIHQIAGHVWGGYRFCARAQ
jgi:hypothetical protein